MCTEAAGDAVPCARGASVGGIAASPSVPTTAKAMTHNAGLRNKLRIMCSGVLACRNETRQRLAQCDQLAKIVLRKIGPRV